MCWLAPLSLAQRNSFRACAQKHILLQSNFPQICAYLLTFARIEAIVKHVFRMQFFQFERKKGQVFSQLRSTDLWPNAGPE